LKCFCKNPQIKEGQTRQWSKEKGTNNDLQNTIQSKTT